MRAREAREAVKSALEARGDVVFAYLFGSRVSGLAGPLSDLDVAVYARAPLAAEDRAALQTELQERTRSARVDLVDLRAAPPLLAYEVVSSGETLFVRDVDAQNRFERAAILRGLDTQRLRDVQNLYLRESLRRP